MTNFNTLQKTTKHFAKIKTGINNIRRRRTHSVHKIIKLTGTGKHLTKKKRKNIFF